MIEGSVIVVVSPVNVMPLLTVVTATAGLAKLASVIAKKRRHAVADAGVRAMPRTSNLLTRVGPPCPGCSSRSGDERTIGGEIGATCSVYVVSD